MNAETSPLEEYAGDGPTLRQVAARCCKTIDIGAAVLPKPLCIKDFDEEHDGDDEHKHEPGADFRLPPEENERIAKATIEGGPEGASYQRFSSSMAGEGLSPSIYTNQYKPSGTRYARVLSTEFNSIVIEHHLKWAPLCHAEPGPLPDLSPTDRLGRYDFHSADLMVDWALARGMKVKGHVLCWHVTTPPLVEDLPPDQVREQLRRHIFTTMGHFRGRIKVWDVVNESLAPDGTLAENVFLRKLGPGYIEQCFRWAHEADPDAFLIYNDNKVEGMGPDSPKGCAGARCRHSGPLQRRWDRTGPATDAQYGQGTDSTDWGARAQGEHIRDGRPSFQAAAESAEDCAATDLSRYNLRGVDRTGLRWHLAVGVHR